MPLSIASDYAVVVTTLIFLHFRLTVIPFNLMGVTLLFFNR